MVKDGSKEPKRILFPAVREKSEFWDPYPSKADDFAARVQAGIIYTFRHRLPSLRQPRDTYRGIPRSEVARDLVFRLADPEGFSQRHGANVVRAIDEFVQDKHDALAKWRQEKDEAAQEFEEASRLPTPPLGFHWAHQPRKWVPSRTYRLVAG